MFNVVPGLMFSSNYSELKLKSGKPNYTRGQARLVQITKSHSNKSTSKPFYEMFPSQARSLFWKFINKFTWLMQNLIIKLN